MAMVEGEAGIGKTHLLRAFVIWAKQQGARVSYAACREAEADLPYSVMIRAFRTLLGQRDIMQEASVVATLRAQPWLPLLLRFLPELAQWIEAQPMDQSLAGLPQEKVFNFAPGQIYEGAAQIISTIARQAPLVVVLEDLHWADTATLDLLSAVYRRLHSSPVMIVGSYRPEEVYESHPLHRLMTRLSRIYETLRVRLRPLEPAAIPRLIDSLMPVARAEEARQRVDVQSWSQQVEGIPAFWVAWARLVAGGETPDTLPRNLRGIHELLLTRLEPDARHVLEAMAVLGTDANASLLAAVAKLPRDRVEAALRHLTDDEIVAVDAGTYAIADTLLARVAYEMLGEEQRQHLHLRAGQVLSVYHRAALESVAARLATHYDVAGQPAIALRYMMMAGDWAYRLFALDEAQGLYWDALSRAMLVGDAQAQTTIYTVLGKIYAELGRHRTALEHFYAALGGAPSELRPEGRRQQALIRVHIARSLGTLGEYEQAQEFLQQALQAVADGHDPGTNGAIWLHLAWVEEHLRNRKAALAIANQALEAAQSAKALSLEADIALLLALLNWRQQDLDQAQALCQHSLRIREHIKDTVGSAHVWHYLGMIERDRGQFQAARHCFAMSAEIYHQIGEWLLEAMVRAHWGDTCAAANDLAASVEQFRQAFALYEEAQGLEIGLDLPLWTHSDFD